MSSSFRRPDTEVGIILYVLTERVSTANALLLRSRTRVEIRQGGSEPPEVSDKILTPGSRRLEMI